MTENKAVPSIFAAPSPAAGTNPPYNATPIATATPYQYTTPTPATTTTTTMDRSYNNNPHSSSSSPPPGAGTDQNLPQNIRDIAKPRGRVIAWSKLDPALEGEISKYICCRTFGMFVLPCFWIHLLCMWPCLLAAKSNAENATRSQYWILTTTELKIVVLDHDQCCCPNMMKSGDIVKTVPLENITDCGLDARGTGWVNNQAGDVPTIYIDTASSGGHPNNKRGHEATGIGLKDYDWFIQQILHQRDVLKGGGGAAAAPAPQAMYRPPAGGGGGGGGGGKSTAERIQELTQLRDQGIITEAEFQQQRQAIISSI